MCIKPRVVLYVYGPIADNKEKLMPSDLLIQKSVKLYRSAVKGISDDAEILVQRTPKGKPVLSELNGMHVSLTHSGKYYTVAVAECKVGIDLQIHERFGKETESEAEERYRKLSHRFFHPEENDYVQGNPMSRFFEVWCAKESYVKYTGEGIDDSFWLHSVMPEKLSDFGHSWQALDAYFQTVIFSSGYSMCVCSETPVDIEVHAV